VVGVPYPGEGATYADSNGQIGYHPSDEHRIVVVLVVNEDERDAKDQPHKARDGTPRVDASYMLQRRRAAQPEDERRPLEE
jgi:hypothetical protein